ncbi:unnamed protein product, partial [Chrysoparadoxa australica]
AGNDGTVVFYDPNGGKERTFDFPNAKEFTVASFNPTGDAVVVGNFNSFYVFAARGDEWEEAGVKKVDNLYSVTALGWKTDGSRLAVGALCGVVDLYDACVKRSRYKGRFEFTYVSLSQVIVKRLTTGARIVLKSHFGCEILKINIFQDRYVVANTTETLLLGDLNTFELSEIPWQSNENANSEKFIFDYPRAAIVFHAGELCVVEYGKNDVLGAVRTDHTRCFALPIFVYLRPMTLMPGVLSSLAGYSAHLLSVRLREERDCKKIAYLLDQQTVSVRDLVTQASTTITHDSRIDWLELNVRGDLLLFRDKRR